jgi:membrane dipeptidase
VPTGLEDVSRYPALLDALRAKSWSEDDLRQLASGNIVRVLHDAEAVSFRLRDERFPSIATLEQLDGADAAGKQLDGADAGEEPLGGASAAAS